MSSAQTRTTTLVRAVRPGPRLVAAAPWILGHVESVLWRWCRALGATEEVTRLTWRQTFIVHSKLKYVGALVYHGPAMVDIIDGQTHVMLQAIAQSPRLMWESLVKRRSAVINRPHVRAAAEAFMRVQLLQPDLDLDLDLDPDSSSNSSTTCAPLHLDAKTSPADPRKTYAYFRSFPAQTSSVHHALLLKVTPGPCSSSSMVLPVQTRSSFTPPSSANNTSRSVRLCRMKNCKITVSTDTRSIHLEPPLVSFHLPTPDGSQQQPPAAQDRTLVISLRAMGSRSGACKGLKLSTTLWDLVTRIYDAGQKPVSRELSILTGVCGIRRRLLRQLQSWSACVQHLAARRIQATWRRCISDPSYAVCRRRLDNEASELSYFGFAG